MSVSGTDRARFNQRLTETREEAEEREAKLLLRKNEQLKRAAHDLLSGTILVREF